MGSGPSKQQILLDELKEKKRIADEEREALEKSKKKATKATKKLANEGTKIEQDTDKLVKEAEQKAIDIEEQKIKEAEEHRMLSEQKAATLERHKENAKQGRETEVELLVKKEHLEQTKITTDESTGVVDGKSDVVCEEITVEEQRAESARQMKVRYEEAAKAIAPVTKQLPGQLSGADAPELGQNEHEQMDTAVKEKVWDPNQSSMNEDENEDSDDEDANEAENEDENESWIHVRAIARVTVERVEHVPVEINRVK